MNWIHQVSQNWSLRLLTSAGLGLFLLTSNGCDGFRQGPTDFKNNSKSPNTIRVAVLERPLIYTRSKNNEALGIDHDLLVKFARDHQLRIEWMPFSSHFDVLRSLHQGEADIGLGRFHRNSKYTRGLLEGPGLEDTHLSLFCRRDLRIRSFKDLSFRRVIQFEIDSDWISSQELLQWVPQARVDLWMNGDVSTAFREISKKQSDCVVADDFEGQFWAETFFAVEKVQNLSSSLSLHWILPPSQKILAQVLDSWMIKASRQDLIPTVHERYHHSIQRLNQEDVRRFFIRLRNEFRFYKSLFIHSSREHQLPWQMMAAVAYQESQWNSQARSPTGVRGLMQLTEETAQFVDVQDRLDPKESIRGGIRYLKFLSEQFPRSLEIKEKWPLILAAYNIGLGHLMDAQKIAISQGKSPWSWRDLKTTLPLLEEEKFYRKTQFGAARGKEAVQYVERTLAFYQLLVLRQN